MILNVESWVAALTIAVGVGVAPAFAAPDSHNGTWSVELVTDTGLCNARYSYSVAIRDGAVSPASASAGTRVSGRVSPDGMVGITVSGSGGTGSGSGRLDGARGSGTWSVSSLCSGRWTARRGATRTAEAD